MILINKSWSYVKILLFLNLSLIHDSKKCKIKKGPEGPYCFCFNSFYKLNSALMFSTKFSSSQGNNFTFIFLTVPEASLKTFSTSVHSLPM